MHVLFYLTSFTALVAAMPRPQEDPDEDPSIPISITEELPTATVPVIESTSLNIPITSFPSIIPTEVPGLNFTTSTSKRAGHWEPIPVYSCNCVTLSKPSYPCWAYDDYHKCVFEENHVYGCWVGQNRACPSPSRSCGDLFTSIPLTGRHPCDLGGGFRPERTSTTTTATIATITAA